uniref:Uncharacterized protein n=1 Tax=Triticum urartu TaxID=4572 RepID=A0A8R7K3R4_TRIUA
CPHLHRITNQSSGERSASSLPPASATTAPAPPPRARPSRHEDSRRSVVRSTCRPGMTQRSTCRSGMTSHLHRKLRARRSRSTSCLCLPALLEKRC